jgi:ATP:corrinoid adenosyltransferase
MQQKILKLCEIKRGVSSSVFQAIGEGKRTAYMFIVLRRIEENYEILVSRYIISDKYSMDSSRKTIITGS